MLYYFYIITTTIYLLQKNIFLRLFRNSKVRCSDSPFITSYCVDVVHSVSNNNNCKLSPKNVIHFLDKTIYGQLLLVVVGES